jgi:hypothetical protein
MHMPCAPHRLMVCSLSGRHSSEEQQPSHWLGSQMQLPFEQVV